MRRVSELFIAIRTTIPPAVVFFVLVVMIGAIGCDKGGGGVSTEHEIDYTCTDADGDGYYVQAGCGTLVDFNDNDASIYPGALEVCDDDIDNDSDGYADEGCAPGCSDFDLDGFFAGVGCVTPVDCDDADTTVYTGAVEVCGDDVDNDCDGLVDPGCPPEICADGIDNDGDENIDEECEAVASSVPDTGQTICYDLDGRIFPCPLPGEEFFGQDASYPFDDTPYTKLDNNSNELTDDATAWAMVKDNVTGLIWEVKTDNGNLQDKDFTYTWDDAMDFIRELNIENFGGYSDWRLPTIKELAYIVNYGSYNPAISSTYFPNTRSGNYWSSTSYVADENMGWFLDFIDGGASVEAKDMLCYARAVRGSSETQSFQDNGDGTITDNVTGLMWTKLAAPDSNSWQEALAYCENLTLAGYSDWRLPNVKELRSIVDYSTESPAVDQDFFPDTLGSPYWTSTTYHNNRTLVWVVGFSSGGGSGSSKLNGGYLRAVRDM